MIKIKPYRYILMLLFTASLLVTALTLRGLFPGLNGAVSGVKITKGPDNNINVTVTLPQIKKEIAPLRIKEFLSQTKVADADQGGLKLLDFKHDSILARYGFEKGDIIKEINGQSVNSAQDALRVCDALEKDIFKNRDEKEVKVLLDRNDEDVKINFRIPEFAPEKVSYTLRLEKRDSR